MTGVECRARRRDRTMEALLDAMLPPDGALPAAADAGVGARGARLLRDLPPAVRAAVRFELGLLEHLPRLTGGRPFSRISAERRRVILARLERLPPWLAQALAPMKLVPLLAYGASPQVLTALGAEPGQLVPLRRPLPPVQPLPVRAVPKLPSGLDEVFDVVVVGSGAGGAPVARTLARAGWSVVVVEEGDAFTREDFTGPEIERVGRLYRDGGATVTLGRPPVVVPIGRAVGGTTVVNSGTCLRTPDAVIASWGRRFGVELRPDDLGPYYEEVERTLGVAPVPWHVMGNNGLVAHRGATALGISGKPIDRNADGCHGSGVCAAGCPVDGKRGVHLNYLPQAVEAGAEIFARCRVDRVVIRGGRAVGVTGTLRDARGRAAGPFTLRARRAVVVAAGAPLSPGLLRRSGLRSRSLGSNLRIHPATAVIGLFDEEILGWRGVLQSYQVDALADRGVMLESTFPPPGLALAEIGVNLPAAEWGSLVERFPHLAVLGLLVSDTSTGRVRSLGPDRTPLMTYDVNRHDARRALEGMLLAARILLAAGATEVRPTLAGAGPLRTPAEAEACLSRGWPASALRLTAYHPMGTARMGADPGGVLHGDGRVRGIDRLVVPDASVFPTSLGVNPQVTIMAFAHRAAERMLTRW